MGLDIDAATFAKQHREWCTTIVAYLRDRGPKDSTFWTCGEINRRLSQEYGRARCTAIMVRT